MSNILGVFMDGGPFIVLLLGLAAGFVFHILWRRFWAASAVATVAGSLLWVGGCYVLFFFTAPSELGPPAIVPILLTMVTALAGAIVAGGALRMIRAAR